MARPEGADGMKRLPMGPEQLAQLARALRGVEFFRPLTVAQLDQVLPFVMLYAFDPGEAVFRQGQPGDAFYVVQEGRLEVRMRKWLLGKENSVAELRPGDFFGEMALIAKGRRSASVLCAAAAKLFVLAAVDFEFVIRENPTFAEEMRKMVARRKFQSSMELQH